MTISIFRRRPYAVSAHQLDDKRVGHGTYRIASAELERKTHDNLLDGHLHVDQRWPCFIYEHAKEEHVPFVLSFLSQSTLACLSSLARLLMEPLSCWQTWM